MAISNKIGMREVSYPSSRITLVDRLKTKINRGTNEVFPAIILVYIFLSKAKQQ